jgi:hypothetical protein|tara:strand:- start:354 stop:611 length:258 start_codon:yes stop_codon:yes gene_type:complete
MLDLNMSELQCIRRALGDFISSKENSVYDFSFYVDINKKINDEIYSLSDMELRKQQKENKVLLSGELYEDENIKLTDKENGEMKI